MTSEELSDTDLDEIERRADSASSGPWQSFIEDRNHQSGDTFIRMGGEDPSVPDMYVQYSLPGLTTVRVPDADLDFIAGARQDVPRLVAEVRRLRRLISAEDQ